MKRHSLLVVPIFYFLLTLVLTYPLLWHLQTYVADMGDPLLNTWAMAWGRHALLQPWSSIDDLFNANGFYPYPHSLAFSEHLLPYALLTLPLQGLQLGPVFAHNSAILFSIFLAGWGMALLMTHWTGNRWAGLVAGIIFAFVPARLNHWAHLHQLSIHWLPFIILALDRWLARRQWPDLVLFGLFLNWQLLSTVNYIPQTIILVALFLLFNLLFSWRRFISPRVIGGGLLLLLLTSLVNWPIFKIYFELRELHGFERNLGDARLYGAALTDYFTAPPENLLYGDWLTSADAARPLIPLFSGIVPIGLALIGISSLFGAGKLANDHKWKAFFLIVLVLLAAFLSFGANELALGKGLSPLIQNLLIYRWLFEYVPGFSGLRVPARVAILVFFGLAALAGLGVARLSRWRHLPQETWAVVIILIVIEYLPLPLPGTDVPLKHDIPAVYQHLAANPEDKVVLALPYNLSRGGSNELPRLYYSTYGWYDLINGASGFNPAGLRDLSAQMQHFPDAVSFDVLRQLGVTHLVLRPAEFTPERWQDIWSKLSAYWPSMAGLSQFGDDYLVALRPPQCTSQPEKVLIEPVWTDGQFGLTFSNQTATAHNINPDATARIQIDQQQRRFIAPLFIPAGETRTIPDLLSVPPDMDQPITLVLPAMLPEVEITPESSDKSRGNREAGSPPVVTLDVQFGDTLNLLGYTLNSREGSNCRMVDLRLYWSPVEKGLQPNTQSIVRLADRFGQTIVTRSAHPDQWAAVKLSDQEVWLETHQFPILEPLPAGQYGLMLGVLDGQGVSLLPSKGTNLLVLGPEMLLTDILVRPLSPPHLSTTESMGAFENGITLLGYQTDKTELRAGDWLHLTLYWQTANQLDDDLTVFTQLLDSDGQVWGQQDNPPRRGWYPISLWQPGEVVSDDYFIRLDPATPPGELTLHVGFYRPDTLNRVPVVDEIGNVGGDSLPVATFEVQGD